MMEEEEAAAAQNDTNASQYVTSFSSTSNWTVTDGSLADSVTFESPLSFDDDENPTPPKSPLVLCPPSTDPGPCEITITFARKHEVRQVYVRSTARVYEIYCAPDLCGSSDNEYLCTVRCGVATRDEEVLCSSTRSVEEAASGNSKGGSKELDGKKSRSDSSSSTNEDGWVEVKAVDSPQHDGGNSPAPSNFRARLEGSTQDLYEATAEISDADPCMSIILRLLSLQNKGCVFVDEIFVFGDPVEPDDSENRVSQMENPAGSSLMAMFMPTLLQLSKTRNAGQMRACDTREKQKSQGISAEATDSTNILNNFQQEGDSGLADKQKVEMQETVGSAALPAQVQMPPQVSETKSTPDQSCSRIEKVLDQLVSRVSRVEDLFLRFEERVVKPINSIETRLQQIELQLEDLTNKTQNSGLLHCTRISAPEFSCHDSDDNFVYNNEIPVAESDDAKKCLSSIRPDDAADLVNTYQSRSCLIVTAPEFSNADDEKENDALDEKANGALHEKENDAVKAATVSSEDKTKKALSVDDALAYALAGILSSASPEPMKYNQALVIKAPDFSGEEDSNNGKIASTEVEDGRANSPICFSATDKTECINGSVSTSSDTFCLDIKVEVTTSDDHHSEKTDGVDDVGHHSEEGNDDSQERGIHYITEDKTAIETGDEVSNSSVLGNCETPNQFPENQNDDGSETTEEGAVVNSEFSAATEATEEKSDIDVLQNVLEFPPISSVVNFEMPILDVKFVSLESSNSKYLLEALLDKIPEPEKEIAESNVEAPCAKDNNNDDSQISQQRNLISMDDLEPASAANGNCFSADMDYCSLVETLSNMEGNEIQDCCSHNGNKVVCAGSLI
ncbi:hypothetical protein JRO89_XS05G0150800 [Xanthoceras sorbifolium]|uniref:Uncharacterized protein n=1 Tax=Xanthoceras sorbifolium TaxID=99658 RepID=A0ABQ8I210_9ROSI|nr:hypothetical protein JRO89_XS05G0150800 [Xanthoceras sorbifolium]